MKKIIICVSLLFMCLLTTGCFDYTELNELGIISALGIEKKDKNNFLVSAQIVNIKKTGAESGNEGISKVVTYSGEGKTIEEAIKKISNESSKEIFLAHLKLLILDKDIIKNDLENIVDFFARNTKIKSNFYVATSTTETPLEILKTLTPLDSLPSQDIYNSIENSEKLMGNANVMTFEDFFNTLLQKGINPVFTDLKISGEEKGNDNTDSLKKSTPNAIVEVNNLVTFDRVGNITKLSEEESIGYSFIKNRIKTPVITAKCEGEENYFSVDILSSKNKIETDLKNDTIIFNLSVSGTIGEVNCKEDLTNEKTRNMINNETSKKIKKYVNSTFDLSKKIENDFIGIGNYIYKNETDYFNFNKNSWDKKGITKLKLKTNINLEIIKEGNLEKNIYGRDTNE